MESTEVNYYGDEVLHVEPHGIDPISTEERHGKPRNLFTLWFSANLEFATLTLGALSVGLFGLNLAQAALSIIVGTALGAAAIGFLTMFGYKWGIPQLIQSRGAFGFYGNFVPAFFNFISGIGWYAVNTVLGVYALQWLLPVGFVGDLLIMIVIQAVVSIYGHNLIHFVERISAVFLAVIFLIVSVYALGHIHFGIAVNMKAPLYSGLFGSFVLAMGTSLSYMMGWLTFSSDYSRYLPQSTSFKKAFHSAFWGNVIPAVWLELLGAGLATVKNITTPTDLVTGLMPHVLVVFAMLAIILGTVTANVLNIYSGSLSLLAIDVKWVRTLAPKRWVAAMLLGILGGVLSYLAGAEGYYNSYNNFLLLLGYWVSPWLAIVLVDYVLYRRHSQRIADFYEGSGRIKAGLWAFVLAIAASSFFFNQTLFTGLIAAKLPQLGDISYYVGFVVAAVLYILFTKLGQKTQVKQAARVA
ncbi:purine-cytosine permease family protein [Sulfoacidibacillus thermotolerans]|uniref:Cytosine permease n=1 Tax=Sulfoacidibacillus thermotolerans TaxID=1765684 RepID=A0A2U3D9X6_SULT2|nr:cytosine permease [Sulfoacidibacillus thermotolerans]PWI58076.1 cytosine permease [Sulfoacidibacillus thermotolerans]